MGAIRDVHHNQRGPFAGLKHRVLNYDDQQDGNAGLIASLVMSIFLPPTLYVWFTGAGDVLPVVETEFPALALSTVAQGQEHFSKSAY
jgi:hypothetical protein